MVLGILVQHEIHRFLLVNSGFMEDVEPGKKDVDSLPGAEEMDLTPFEPGNSASDIQLPHRRQLPSEHGIVPNLLQKDVPADRRGELREKFLMSLALRLQQHFIPNNYCGNTLDRADHLYSHL